mgnify:FL=1
MDKDKIKKEAKLILDKFAKALEKVEKKYDLDFNVNREEFERKENTGEKCEDFKNQLLENTPKKDNDFIIAEKGGWN